MTCSPKFSPLWSRHSCKLKNIKKGTRIWKKRFSEEQLIKIFNENKEGSAVEEIYRKYNISKCTYYKWKSKYSDMTLSDVKKLKYLNEENNKLKKL